MKQPCFWNLANRMYQPVGSAPPVWVRRCLSATSDCLFHRLSATSHCLFHRLPATSHCLFHCLPATSHCLFHCFQIENLKGHLRSPGQFFFDPAGRRILYLPLPGQDMAVGNALSSGRVE